MEQQSVLCEVRSDTLYKTHFHTHWFYSVRVQLKCDGTRRHTGGEVKGKLANAVGSQYSSHYLGTRCIQHYYRWCRTPRLRSSRLNWRPAHRADLKGLVSFIERRNLVSAHVTSHFKRGLLSSVNNLSNLSTLEGQTTHGLWGMSNSSLPCS